MPVLVLSDNQILEEVDKKFRESREQGKQLDEDGISNLLKLLSIEALRERIRDVKEAMKKYEC